jgi:hypothetical protein
MAGTCPRGGGAVAPLALGELIVAIAGYATITAWWLWPLPRWWATHSAYFGADFVFTVTDFYLILWAIAWDTHALLTAPWHLFDANIFHPAILSLAYSEHFLGYVPLFAPTYIASGNPILALNVLVFLTYPLCGGAMYALARRWVGAPAAAVAGFFYAFALFRYGTAHVHMLGVHYLPLVLLLSERWFERGRVRDAVCLAGALLLQALSSFYLAYALVFLYVPYVALALVRWRTRLDLRRAIGLLAAGAAAGSVFIVTALPYLRLRDLGVIPSYGDGQVSLGLLPLVSRMQVWKYLSKEGIGSIGYVLVGVALLPPWRARRWPLVVALLIASVCTIAAFGPTILIGGHPLTSPYALLVDIVPGLSTVRGPYRFTIAAHVGFAALAGLGLERLVGRMRPLRAWAAAAIAVAGIVGSYGPIPPLPLHPEVTDDAVPPAYRWLGSHRDGRALLEIPRAGWLEAARRMYLSTYHWLPIVEGYSGYSPDTSHRIHSLARGLPAPVSLQEVVDHVDIGWILVHRDQHDWWNRRWDGPYDGLERVGEWGPDLLLRVTLPTHDDRRARFASTVETLYGTPRTPLEGDCPGEIRVTSALPVEGKPRSDVVLDVQITNRSRVVWPVTSFYPRHLVRLLARVDDDGSPVPTWLPRDVESGDSVLVRAKVNLPSAPGSYHLALELEQVGDGSLARCGVAPLRVPLRVVAATE